MAGSMVRVQNAIIFSSIVYEEVVYIDKTGSVS